MRGRTRLALAAAAMLATFAGCDRAPRAPRMDAADLSDARGGRVGDFPSPANASAAANDAIAAPGGNAQ